MFQEFFDGAKNTSMKGGVIKDPNLDSTDKYIDIANEIEENQPNFEGLKRQDSYRGAVNNESNAELNQFRRTNSFRASDPSVPIVGLDRTGSYRGAVLDRGALVPSGTNEVDEDASVDASDESELDSDEDSEAEPEDFDPRSLEGAEYKNKSYKSQEITKLHDLIGDIFINYGNNTIAPDLKKDFNNMIKNLTNQITKKYNKQNDPYKRIKTVILRREADEEHGIDLDTNQSDGIIIGFAKGSNLGESGLNAGDQIIEVDGKNVTGLPNGKIMELIKLSRAMLTLKVIKNTEPDQYEYDHYGLYNTNTSAELSDPEADPEANLAGTEVDRNTAEIADDLEDDTNLPAGTDPVAGTDPNLLGESDFGDEPAYLDDDSQVKLGKELKRLMVLSSKKKQDLTNDEQAELERLEQLIQDKQTTYFPQGGARKKTKKRKLRKPVKKTTKSGRK